MGDVARDADDKEEELHNMHQQFMQLQVTTEIYTFIVILKLADGVSLLSTTLRPFPNNINLLEFVWTIMCGTRVGLLFSKDIDRCSG